MIKISIAEDNDFLASAIVEKCSFFKDLKVKYRSRDGQELLDDLLEDHIVDVILMDIQMPNMNGIEATRIVKKKYPQIKVIMLTIFDDEEHIFRAIQAGANGYLLKEENAKSIYNSVIEIMNGGAPMSPTIALKALNLLRNPISDLVNSIDYELTKREIEVLDQLSRGLNYQEIADNLFVSRGTIRKHIENTYRKLQVHNKMEAVRLAKKNRII